MTNWKQFEGRKRKANSHIKLGVCDKRETISHQSQRWASSGAGKPLSRVHMTSDKWQRLIACSSTNIPKEHNMDSGRRPLDWINNARPRQQSWHERSSQIIGEGWGMIKSWKNNNKVLSFQTHILWIKTKN